MVYKKIFLNFLYIQFIIANLLFRTKFKTNCYAHYTGNFGKTYEQISNMEFLMVTLNYREVISKLSILLLKKSKNRY